MTASIEQLIADLRSDDMAISAAATNQLKDIGSDEAVDALLALLEDPDYNVRFMAAMTLGLIKSPRSVDPLVVTIKENDDYDVLWAASWALSELGALSAAPLIDVLDHGKPMTRDVAADILASIGDLAAVEPLGRAFRVYGLEDRWETARFGAADALEKFGEDAVEVLVEAMYDEQPAIAERAAQALEAIGTERALRAIDKWRAEQADGNAPAH